jgi:hypothetical protein
VFFDEDLSDIYFNREYLICRYFGITIETFLKLSDLARKDRKWEMLFTPMRLTIAVVLPTTTTSSMERRNTVFTVIHVQETNIQVGI